MMPAGYVRVENGTLWPDPGSEAFGDAEWRLRNGVPTTTALLYAAGVMATYQALVRLPSRDAARKLAALRRAMREVPR